MAVKHSVGIKVESFNKENERKKEKIKNER